MYAYEIGYYSHEESSYIQLMHEEKFSEKRLEEMILACVPDIAERLWDDSLDPDLADLDKHYGTDRTRLLAASSRLRIDFPALMIGVYDHDKEDYIFTLRGLLCERFGFLPLTFEANYVRWGWGDLVAGDWDYEDPDATIRANLIATVRSSLKEYIGHHPEVRERFKIEDVDEFIGKLHDDRCGGEESPISS